MSTQKKINLCVLAALFLVPLTFARDQRLERQPRAAGAVEQQARQGELERPFTPQERAMIRRYLRQRIAQRRSQQPAEARRPRTDQPRPRADNRRHTDQMRRRFSDRRHQPGPYAYGPRGLRHQHGRRHWTDRPHHRMRWAPDRCPYARPYRNQWQGPEHRRPRWDRDHRPADRRQFEDRWTERRRQDEQTPPRRRRMDRPERVEPDDAEPVDPPRPRYRRDRDAQ